MTETPIDTPKKRSRLGLYLMPGLIVVLFIGVSVWWTIATRIVDDRFSRWITNEAIAGRQWSCANRSMAGYPFRIELRCDGLALVATQGHTKSLSIGGFLAIAQIYQTSLVIVETNGPLAVTFVNGQSFSAQWTLMRSSLHFETPSRADRVAWVAEGLRFEGGPPALSGKLGHTEFHLRKIPVETGEATDLEVAFSAADGMLGNLPPPASADLHFIVKKGKILADKPSLSGLEDWRLAGGEMAIDQWDMKRGEQTFNLTGTLSMDETHRLAGKVDFAASGLGDLMKQFNLAPGGMSLGNGSIKLPLQFSKGRVLLGPLKLGDLPALY